MGAQGSKDKKIPPEQLSELIQLTHFEKKELKKWYQGFIKDCPDRTMNQEQFIELYSRFYSHGNADKFATHVFRTFDCNNDGSIGKKQTVSVARFYLIKASFLITCDKFATHVFRTFDCNNDRSIGKKLTV